MNNKTSLSLPKLDFHGREPLFAQVFRHYREQISSRKIEPGTALPPCRNISRQLGVAFQTVNRAFDLLAKDGLVYRRRSLGTIVQSPSKRTVATARSTRCSRIGALPIYMLAGKEVLHNEASRMIFTDYFSGLVDGFDAWRVRFELVYMRPGQPDLELVRTLAESGFYRGFVNFDLTSVATEYMVEQRLPMVILGMNLSSRGVPSVYADHIAGYADAWRHAHSLNHSRVAYVAIDSPIKEIRFAECRAGAALAGVDSDAVPLLGMPAEMDLQQIWHHLQKAFGPWRRGSAWPTLIFAGNDMLACRLLSVLQNNGIAVPADVSIIGFDDVILSRNSNPPLTTIAKPRYAMGFAAAKILTDYLAKRIRAPVPVQCLSTKFIARSTCAIARGS